MLNDNVTWLCKMNHAMNSTHTNMETSQETETNATFKYRAIMRETRLLQKRIDQLMMDKSTTLPRGRLGPLYGNVYSTGNVSTHTLSFYHKLSTQMYCLAHIYIYLFRVFAGTSLYIFPSFYMLLHFLSKTNIGLNVGTHCTRWYRSTCHQDHILVGSNMSFIRGTIIKRTVWDTIIFR